MKRFLLGSLLLSSAITFGQEMSNFNAVTLNYKMSPKFFIYAEGQLRSINEFSYPDYYEIKGGLGYNITKNHKPLIGIGRYVTYKDKRSDKEEFRVWLQDVIDIKKGRVKFENRFRLEQSWFYEPKTDKNSTRNRLRYRLNVTVPINNSEVKEGTLFANAYNEIFFSRPADPTLSRNRVYGGLGYQIDKTFGISGGYLWQREFDHKKGHTNVNFIYMNLNISIDGTDHANDREYHFPGAD